MSYNYGPLATKTVGLIAKYGGTMVLEFAVQAPADADKPWRGPGAAVPTTKSPKGVISQWDKDEIDGERIRSSDLKLLVAAQDAELAGQDIDRAVRCQVGTVWYGATNVSPIDPTGAQPLLYTLRLRQG